MKKLSLTILFVILTAVTVLAFESDYAKPSSVYAADQNAIVSGPGYLFGIMVVTDGTNPVTVKVYDNTTATGTKIIPDWTVTTGAADRYQRLSFNPPLNFNTGLSIDITIGAGSASYVVFTREKS
jgi:hypothetical protein